jgi:hypothetical protein
MLGILNVPEAACHRVEKNSSCGSASDVDRQNAFNDAMLETGNCQGLETEESSTRVEGNIHEPRTRRSMRFQYRQAPLRRLRLAAR